MNVQTIEEKRLAEEIARLDRIEAEARMKFDDPELSLSDIAAIQQTARQCGVTERMAHLRAKGLGLLSYQRDETR